MNAEKPKRTQVAPAVRPSQPTTSSTSRPKVSTAHSFINPENDNQINRENILFVYLDLHSQLLPHMIHSLRSLNDRVQTFDSDSLCFDFLQTSHDRIFFICPTNDKDLVKAVHDLSAVEAIFILAAETQFDRSRLPKIDGIYSNFEELLVGLRCTLEWFEQTQVEVFAVEKDRMFLWSQLWKEEFLKPTYLHVASNKESLVSVAENHYRGNARVLQSIGWFNQSYSRSDALQWSFHSVFPSRFLHHALRCRDIEQLDQCRFLLHDISHVLHRSTPRKTSRQLYRGMKLTPVLLDRLMAHTGKLICPKGYFTCIKSRMTTLKFAWSLDHRTDLKPVLLKITCPASMPPAELFLKNTPTLVIFDLYTAFRVTHVNLGPISVVRMETAEEEGLNMAKAYRAKNKSESVKDLLAKLLIVPTPPSPAKRSLLDVKKDMALSKLAESFHLKDQTVGQEFLLRNEIDQALAHHRHIKPRTVQVLHTIGQIYAKKKGDYESAISYHKEAIRIQEQVKLKTKILLLQSATMPLGIAHENRQQFDQALKCHTQSYELLKKSPNVSQAAVANSLLGIANAQWGLQHLPEALDYAQQALALNESLKPSNNLNLATNLAIIGNIHHGNGDTHAALHSATRALALMEKSVPPDSMELASLLNNVGTMQLGVGSFSDARESFARALKICEKTLPTGHPKRVTMETNIKRITEMEQNQLRDNAPDDS